MDQARIFEIARQELTLVQQQVDKYDEIGYRIKAWAVTLWVTLFGWSLQFDNARLLLLDFLAVLIFFFLDAVNKNFRQDYKERRNRIAAALQQFGRSDSWPEDFRTPEVLQHRTAGIIKQAAELHVLLLYVPLAVLALITYLLL